MRKWKQGVVWDPACAFAWRVCPLTLKLGWGEERDRATCRLGGLRQLL